MQSVALRKESVDRNCDSEPVTDKAWASLSARRAWIEIWGNYIVIKMSDVALRKESVDRNIAITYFYPLTPRVALRKESVDRNRNRPAGTRNGT